MNAYITALHRFAHQLALQFVRQARSAALVLFTALGTWGIAHAAASGPAQLPMMSVATGAAPNVMLTLDNSGSMSWYTLDNYQFKYPDSGEVTKSTSKYTEYYNWKCKSASDTGPFKDDEGYYYCLTTTQTNACPAGFTGPTGTAPNQVCTRQEPVYSCPVGATGPTLDPSDGKRYCTENKISYSCSDSSYAVQNPNDPNTRTCYKAWTEYTCPANYTGPTKSGGSWKCTPVNPTSYTCSSGYTVGSGAVGSGNDSTQCYKCNSSKWNSYTLALNNGAQDCKRKSSWYPDQLVKVAGTPAYQQINATPVPKSDSKPNLVVATPYVDRYQATSTQQTLTYDNVQVKVKNTRKYQNKSNPADTNAAVFAQNSRDTIGGTNIVGGDWYAIRSAQVNPLYYDPTVTYKPRVDHTGSGIAEDAAAADFVYNYNKSVTDDRSGYSGAGSTAIPKMGLTTISDAKSNSLTFTYVVCSTYNIATCTVQKPSDQVISVAYDTASVPLPLGHARTDCGGTKTSPATSCTGAAERLNIARWYKFYATRMKATVTSLGFALANPDYSGKMRVGYYNINNNGKANSNTITSFNGTYSSQIRPFVLGSNTDNTNYVKPLYDWLYSNTPNGGTPLHNAVEKVGDYYASAQPWYNDTISASSGSLACRRAYNVFFSDGAWNSGTGSTQTEYYNSTKLAPINWGTGSTKATLDKPFEFNKNGDPDTPALYTAYPVTSNNSSDSLAAMTAKYAWAYDLQPTLANKITTRMGEPVSWQNMKTYTIGYGIQPTGFNFEQVKDWQNTFAKLGYQSDMVPSWHSKSSWDDDERINDFIHAGYAGGGKSYSVFTADQIQRAFDAALSDVVSASGNDAGVAVSGASSSVSTIEGALKYTVDYKTLDNSGDVKAWKLDANGSNASISPMWSAALALPQPANRKMSTWSSSSTGALLLNHNTLMSSLPADVKTPLLGSNGLIDASSADFIKYLRGEEGISNPLGETYRRRSSLIAASVNAPPVFVGGRLNMGYDRSNSAVSGKTSYAGYITDKGTAPGTIYAPTNDGQVHVINAADDTLTPPQAIKNANGTIRPGVELWSYLMKSSLGKMEKFSNAAYGFEYVLDGPVVEGDIYNTTADRWEQTVFGSQGRAAVGGVYSLYAPIDKSDASNINRIPNEQGYRWDVTYTGMGYITTPAVSGQTKSGDWVVLVSSGHYASPKAAGLFVLNAVTGAQLAFIQLPAGFDFKRGLGAVTAVRDASRQIVAAYAGDDGGNLWRFDLSGTSPSTWGVSYNKPLFTTPGNQPIYVAPAWTPHPGDGQAFNTGSTPGCIDGRSVTASDGTTYNQQCGAMVVFGTGMMMDADDKINTSVQTIYGIWDKTPIGTPNPYTLNTITKSELLAQTIDATVTAGAGISADKSFYKVSNNIPDWKVNKGWYLDIGVLGKTGSNPTGERVIGDVFNLGSNVFVSSVTPDTASATAETCTVKASPPNYLYGLDALTGGLKRAFDQNGDGRADQFAIAYIPGGGFTRGSVITQTSKDPNSSVGIGLPTEGNADLQIKNKCTSEQGYNTGISGSMQLFDGCAAGWKRTWRQILNPPVL